MTGLGNIDVRRMTKSGSIDVCRVTRCGKIDVCGKTTSGTLMSSVYSCPTITSTYSVFAYLWVFGRSILNLKYVFVFR